MSYTYVSVALGLLFISMKAGCQDQKPKTIKSHHWVWALVITLYFSTGWCVLTHKSPNALIGPSNSTLLKAYRRKKKKKKTPRCQLTTETAFALTPQQTPFSFISFIQEHNELPRYTCDPPGSWWDSLFTSSDHLTDVDLKNITY